MTENTNFPLDHNPEVTTLILRPAGGQFLTFMSETHQHLLLL